MSQYRMLPLILWVLAVMAAVVGYYMQSRLSIDITWSYMVPQLVAAALAVPVIIQLLHTFRASVKTWRRIIFAGLIFLVAAISLRILLTLVLYLIFSGLVTP
jgi:hypothetical protein